PTHRISRLAWRAIQGPPGYQDGWPHGNSRLYRLNIRGPRATLGHIPPGIPCRGGPRTVRLRPPARVTPWGVIHGAALTLGPDLPDRGRHDDEGESVRWDGLGLGLGELGTSLDEQHAAAVRLSMSPADDHEPDGLVAHESGRLHRILARRRRTGVHRL